MNYIYPCPICHGHGTVSKPPWVPGDVDHWVSTSTMAYECRACQGTGIVLIQNNDRIPTGEKP